MRHYFSKGEASIFIQHDPDQGYRLLTCSAAGNIEIPEGDVTAVRVPDPVHPGRWQRVALIQGEGDPPTVTITRPMRRVAELLPRCPFNLRFNFSCAGERGFDNYESTIVLVGARVTGRTVNEPAPMERSADAITVDIPISAAFALMWDRLHRYSRTSAGTSTIRGVYVAPEECPGRCSAGRASTSLILAVDGSGDVYRSEDGGVSWDSVTVDEEFSLQSVIMGGNRTFVAGESGTGGVVAYSDDLSTWTGVSLAYPISALTRDDVGILYAAGTGSVLASQSRGADWETVISVTGGQFNALATDGDLVYAVGDDGLLAVGRETEWTQVTTGITDDLVACDVNADGRLIMIASDGSVYRYYNEAVESAGEIGAQISQFRFVFGTIGIAVGSAGTYITEDGGVTWSRFDSTGGSAVYPTTSGYQPRWVIGGASGAIYLIA